MAKQLAKLDVRHETISLQLPERVCRIHVGNHILASTSLLKQAILGHQVMIVTQPAIASHYLPLLIDTLEKDYQCDSLLILDGDQQKNIAQWQAILSTLIHKKHERSTTLIALGGGVVGDLTGFAAACYLRGVNYIQIPTTLMAQVDSAIGGKTAINVAEGKNLIGAFHQPVCVISDIDVLKTLPLREYLSGMAEAIKYSLILDGNFFDWIENHTDELLARQPEALLHLVARCSRLKSEVVMADEKEQGLRSLLNFGHTFGHALEVAGNFNTWLHGEAVAVGMRLAAEISCELNWLSQLDLQRIKALFAKLNLTTSLDNLPQPTKLVELMQTDKKIVAGKLNLILLTAIGNAVKTDSLSTSRLITLLTSLIARST
jgi:3-dehydroquinate synthase